MLFRSVILQSPEDNGALFAANKDGKVGFRRDDTLEFAFDYTLPVNKAVKLELVSKPGETRLFVDGQDKGVAQLTTFKSVNKLKMSTFTLPAYAIGQKKIKVSRFRLAPVGQQ